MDTSEVNIDYNGTKRCRKKETEKPYPTNAHYYVFYTYARRNEANKNKNVLERKRDAQQVRRVSKQTGLVWDQPSVR